MPTGVIEARQEARLREIGDWLRIHGESVHGTRGGPFEPEPSETDRTDRDPAAPAGRHGSVKTPRFASTHRERTVYVHVLEWPAVEPLVLPALERRIVASSVVGGGPAEARQTAAGTEIRVAPAARRPIDTVVRLELDGPAGTLAPR